MSQSNAAVQTNDRPPPCPNGNPNWRKGMPSNFKHGRNSTKTLQTFMELRNKLQVQMKHRYALPEYDAICAIAEMACDTSLPAELRFKCHAEVARYTYPTLKQVEITGKDGGAIETKTAVADSLITAIMSGQMALPTVLEAVVRSEAAEVIGEDRR